jgi:ribosomal protein S12 methylthiotransferase accessory factor
MSNETDKTMSIRFAGGRRVDATYGGFTIHTDQSPDSGGEGAAPEPFDLFLASIGTCAGAYVAAFCATRDIPLKEIEIVQRWSRTGDGRLEQVTLDIRLPESFPERYREALLRSAARCSVKRTLQNPPEVEVRTVPYADA